MPHARQQVREAAGQILTNNAGGMWQHVFESRIKPTRSIATFVMVYVDSEDSEILDINPSPFIDRQMQLMVKAFCKITDDEKIEDDVDAVASQVETVLTFDAMNTLLSGTLKSLALQTSSIVIDRDDTERTHAALTLSFVVRVLTIEGQPETLR